MNIIEITKDELQTVMDWRDKNKGVVRNFKPFLLDGRISINGVGAVAFVVFPQRERYSITLKYYIGDEKMLTVDILTTMFGVVKVTDVCGTKAYQRAGFTAEQKNVLMEDIIGVFFAVNAYFLHGISLDKEVPVKVAKTHVNGEKKSGYSRTSVVKHLNKTYTIHGKNIPTVRNGTRTRHCEAWEVVGHYRRYKSGKVVYIAPYVKGKNKTAAKGKTYKF